MCYSFLIHDQRTHMRTEIMLKHSALIFNLAVTRSQYYKTSITLVDHILINKSSQKINSFFMHHPADENVQWKFCRHFKFFQQTLLVRSEERRVGKECR